MAKPRCCDHDAVLTAWQAGATRAAIAARHNISVNTVRQIVELNRSRGDARAIRKRLRDGTWLAARILCARRADGTWMAHG